MTVMPPIMDKGANSFELLPSKACTILSLETFEVGRNTRSKSVPTLPWKNRLKIISRKLANFLLKKGTRIVFSSTMRAREFGELMLL